MKSEETLSRLSGELQVEQTVKIIRRFCFGSLKRRWVYTVTGKAGGKTWRISDDWGDYDTCLRHSVGARDEQLHEIRRFFKFRDGIVKRYTETINLDQLYNG